MIKRETIILFIILFGAFLLRVWGLDYGLPYFFVGDEQSLIGGALRMAELKTLIPAFHPDEFRLLYYPPLMPYIYLFFLSPIILLQYLIGCFANFEDFKNYLILNPGSIWLAGRCLNALIGVATVYLLYLIGQKIFNRWIGLLAALFLALSFFHNQLSHFARHWVPAVFFAYLVVFLAFSIYKNPQRKYYLWAGLFSGLAFGISYITALSWLVILSAHFLSNKGSLIDKLKSKNIWLSLIIFLLLATIFVLLYPQEFFRITFGEDTGFKVSKTLIGYLSSFIYYAKVLVFTEPVLCLFSLLGLLFLWFRSKKDWLIFLFWPLAYITILYLFFHHEPRYIILIIPWLCLLAGYALYGFMTKLRSPGQSQTLLASLILILIFSYPLITTLQYSKLLNQKDTRILAQEWIEENISRDNKIITNWIGIKLTAKRDSILLQQALDEDSLRTDDRTLLSLDNQEYPQSVFNVLRLHFISHKLPNDLSQYVRENNYQYFIVQYWQKEELSEQDKSIIKEAQLIKSLHTGLINRSLDINGNFLEPISIIFSLKRLGPIVEIYQL